MYGDKWGDIDYSREARPKITKAFRGLRKIGFVARQSFWCCSSCAWAALEEKDAGKPIVFYHKQGNDYFKRTGNVYLTFGRNVDNSDDEDVANIGKQIVSALTREGLTVEWDGTAGTTIQVVTKTNT